MRVKLPSVRAVTIDHTLWLICYNSKLNLNIFKYGMKNIACPFIRAFGDDYTKFHNNPNDSSRGIFRAFVNDCV